MYEPVTGLEINGTAHDKWILTASGDNLDTFHTLKIQTMPFSFIRTIGGDKFPAEGEINGVLLLCVSDMFHRGKFTFPLIKLDLID